VPLIVAGALVVLAGWIAVAASEAWIFPIGLLAAAYIVVADRVSLARIECERCRAKERAHRVELKRRTRPTSDGATIVDFF
jgi:hypothetical protein